MTTLAQNVPSLTISRLLDAARRSGPLWRAAASIGMAFVITAMLIMIAGKNPLLAYYHLFMGAVGSWDRVVVGLNRTTPYLLCAVGIALCFRGKVLNIGAEGQLAIGGAAASAVALFAGGWPAWALLPLRWSQARQVARHGQALPPQSGYSGVCMKYWRRCC